MKTSHLALTNNSFHSFRFYSDGIYYSDVRHRTDNCMGQ